MNDLAWLFPWLLFLHVLGAIVAFGPSFAFPFIGAMGGSEREHANFATRVSYMISRRLVVPIALTMPVTGFGMILVAGLDLSSRAYWWLGIAIVLYVVAIAFAIGVNWPSIRRVIELTSAPPGPDGPAAELPGLIARVKRGGQLLAVLIVVITFLMVVKPQF